MGVNPKKPPQQLWCHVRHCRLLLPGRMTCRPVSRDRPAPANPFARWCARDVEVVRLTRAASVAGGPPRHEPVLAVDPRCVPNRGKHSSGLDMCWNGAHRRAEKGLEIATRAWVDGPHPRAYTLRVAQTAPAPLRDTAAPRLAAALAPMARVVTTPSLPARTDLAVEGDCSQKTCVDGLGALAWQGLGQLRREAPRRHLSSGPRRNGPGRPQPSAGQVDRCARAGCEPGAADDAARALAAQVVKHPQCQRPLPCGVGRHRSTGGYALRFSPDVALSAQPLYR